MRCRSNLPRSFGHLVELGLVTAMLSALISSASATEPQQAADNVTVWSNLKYSEASDACILDVAVPKERVDKPRPLIVVIHGGGWLEGDKSSFSNLEQAHAGQYLRFRRPRIRCRDD